MSSKTTSVRISLKVDGENKWYALFSSCLQENVEKYNSDNKCNQNLDEIDEDKLRNYPRRQRHETKQELRGKGNQS